MNTVATQIELANSLAKDYRAIGDRLRAYKNHRFQVGSHVQVNDPKFTGIGVVTLEDACPPDKLPVILESGNTWWYPIENCTRVAPSTCDHCGKSFYGVTHICKD